MHNYTSLSKPLISDLTPALFTYQMRDTFQLSMQHPFKGSTDRLTDIVCVTVLAVLKGKAHNRKCFDNKQNIKVERVSYSDIEKFIKHYNSSLIKSFPTLADVPNQNNIRTYCQQYLDIDSFVNCFIDWTLQVSDYYPEIKPYSKELAKVALMSKPFRFVICIASNWKYANSGITNLVEKDCLY
ncbi:hypothetical protein VB711_22165 [Cronbergia sp. UHCC 0137]|uniref:hypothetical protein n=1 Tax=Cronbergia sp. UHCC 0137 TaxID=3110239 RepID=UPI002B21C0A3|nr:hypothetical protein [Cronbergia sp. UHCC 0137]MEA5620523.1 hypothetical protein [Cronbergia sp. UHCC 0137]